MHCVSCLHYLICLHLFSLYSVSAILRGTLGTSVWAVHLIYVSLFSFVSSDISKVLSTGNQFGNLNGITYIDTVIHTVCLLRDF